MVYWMIYVKGKMFDATELAGVVRIVSYELFLIQKQSQIIFHCCPTETLYLRILRFFCHESLLLVTLCLSQGYGNI